MLQVAPNKIYCLQIAFFSNSTAPVMAVRTPPQRPWARLGAKEWCAPTAAPHRPRYGAGTTQGSPCATPAASTTNCTL